MHSQRLKQKDEQKALQISMLGSTVFVVLELIMAIVSSSQSVLMDSIYDSVELIMVLVSLLLVPLFYKSSNEKRPFGYQQVESVFVVIKGVTMVSVAVGLIVNDIQIILHGGRHVNYAAVSGFELIGTILGLIFIFILWRMNRGLSSLMVDVEIQTWKIDTISSLGMAIAFVLPQIIQATWFQSLVPYLDQVIAIILSCCILPEPIRAVVTSLKDLMLLPPEEETRDTIHGIVTPILDTFGYHDLSYDIVRTGRKLWISVYITFDHDMISLGELRKLQATIIEALTHEYQDFYFELLPEVAYTGETEVKIEEEE